MRALPVFALLLYTNEFISFSVLKLYISVTSKMSSSKANASAMNKNPMASNNDIITRNLSNRFVKKPIRKIPSSKNPVLYKMSA